jgi:glycine cleavage system H lipoate-binding protein
MSVLLGLIFLTIALGVTLWLRKKGVPVTEEKVPLSIWQKMRPVSVAEEKTSLAKLFPACKGIFVHPGHAWVEVIGPNLVAVGTDGFTRSVFGSVEELSLPEVGATIEQGGKAWKLKRRKRQVVQTSPISGKVVEINHELVDNPRLLIQKETKKNWILKVKPIRLKKELQNLLHGNVLSRWNQAVKEQLVATLTMASFPVLQEGGEIKPDLGDELTSEQWENVSREFFDDIEREQA